MINTENLQQLITVDRLLFNKQKAIKHEYYFWNKPLLLLPQAVVPVPGCVVFVFSSSCRR